MEKMPVNNWFSIILIIRAPLPHPYLRRALEGVPPREQRYMKVYAADIHCERVREIGLSAKIRLVPPLHGRLGLTASPQARAWGFLLSASAVQPCYGATCAHYRFHP